MSAFILRHNPYKQEIFIIIIVDLISIAMLWDKLI